MSLSSRIDWSVPRNRVALAKEARARSGEETLDLTETNPTRVGLEYPLEALAEVLSRAAAAPYSPDPMGLPAAREALAADLSLPGDEVSPDDLVLTASTSEAYSFLFKLLLDPGANLITPTPSYPLLEHLAGLELVTLRHIALERVSSGGAWALHVDEVGRAMDADTGAVVVIHPNNPTGSWVRQPDQDAVAKVCAERSIALISDEVFFDYPLQPPTAPPRPAASRSDALSFSLGGLSKSAGLPHWKLGWIRIGGPATARASVRNALELIADSFLSVSTPVQVALPDLLPIGKAIRAAIRERIAGNLERLRSAASLHPSIELLSPEAGWSAVIRVPRVSSDDDLVVSLIEQTGIIVQPGYFFDFAQEGYLVISLLPRPDLFARAVDGMLQFLAERTR